MSIKTITIDDLTGAEDATTRTFTLDGATYLVDLTDENAAMLAQALEPFIKVGRKKGTAPRRHRSKPKADAPRVPQVGKADIREWARKHGKKVSDRGRVPVDIVDEYNRAHTDMPAFSA